MEFIESAPEIAIRSRNRNGFCQAPHHEIDQINPRGPRKGRASLEQHIAPGYEAGNTLYASDIDS